MLDAYISALETDGKYEEACAYALFHLDLQRALDSLRSSVNNRDNSGSYLSYFNFGYNYSCFGIKINTLFVTR